MKVRHYLPTHSFVCSGTPTAGTVAVHLFTKGVSVIRPNTLISKSLGIPSAPLCAVLLLCSALFGCSDGGNGHDSTGDPQATPVGQALLGPVVGASVDLYPLSSPTVPVCTTITTDSDTLEKAGLIEFDDECLAGDGPYIVAVSGGSDIDADDDGVANPSPKPVNGSLFALLTAEQIRGQDWKVNILTHAIYARVRYMLALGMGQEAVLAQLTPLANELLQDDINGDGVVDYRDVLAWSPRRSDSGLRMSADEVHGLTESIHAGTSREYLALNPPGLVSIVYEPEVSRSVFSVAGDRAYICGEKALEVVDLSQPQNLSRIAHYPDFRVFGFSGIRLGDCAATTDGYVYYFELIGDSIGVLTLEGASSVAVTLVPNAGLPAVREARVIGDRLYVSTFDPLDDVQGQLEIYDIENRLAPELLSSTAFDGVIRDFTFGEGSLLYAIVSGDELVVLDGVEGASPQAIGRFDIPGNAGSVAVNGDRGYLSLDDSSGASYRAELLTVDVSVPTDIKAVGKRLAVNSDLSQLQIFGSSLLGFQIDEPSELTVSTIYRMVQFGLGDPDAPERIGALRGSEFASSGSTRPDFALANGFAFLMGGLDGLRSVTLPTPSIDPGLVAFEPTAGKVSGLRISNEVAYLAVPEVGLYAIDITDPTNPETISLSQGEDEKNTDDLAVNGDTALLLNGDTGLLGAPKGPPGTRIVDISDPSSITQIGNIAMEGSFTTATGAVIKDNIAFIAAFQRGLSIADIRDPANPVALANFPLPDERTWYTGIGIADDHLLALDNRSGMDIIDISNPAQPVVVSSYTSTLGPRRDPWNPENVVIRGGFAYINQTDLIVHGFSTGLSPPPDYVEILGGLEIIDISNPLSPTFVSTVATSGKSLSAALSDNLLFVMDSTGLIDVIDNTDPVQPQLLHSIRVGDTLTAIAADENFVYVAGANGLYVFQRPNFDGLP
ncbi:Uncharacterised protein [Halioglobus japonicus]|nr:Uncharacterised protein [Halioglobus japonicus]